MGAKIDRDGRYTVTAGEDGTICLREAPREAPGLPDQIVLRMQVLTGAELDGQGNIRPLDDATWRRRREALVHDVRGQTPRH
jgi:hypothetical protein